jgi:deoxyribose-phosphate aldolase
MLLREAREQLTRYCHRFQADGLVVGTAGNLSVREGEHVAITPSGVDYQAMTPELVCVVRAQDGALVEGALAPTSELQLHLSAYRATGAGAVVHTHATASTAVASIDGLESLPSIHYYVALFGDTVPVAPYATYGSEELARNVEQALSRSSGCLMANHGSTTVGPTLESAYTKAQQLEWMCEVYLRATSLGAPRLLGSADIQTAQSKLRSYGQTPPPGSGTTTAGPAAPHADVPDDLAGFIDHTLLRPEASADEIVELCREARKYGFASVCVNPAWVKPAARALRGSSVKVASVIGFPFGASPPEIKAMEARRAIRDGARELDMVINIGALKSGDTDLVRDDIGKVSEACREAGVALKVIIETAYLTDEEKVIASHLARQAKATFVKTSTGYGPGGATVHDVLLMRETVGPQMGIKASGGIRTREDVRDMIAAGATRIGTSHGPAILGVGSSPDRRSAPGLPGHGYTPWRSEEQR